MFGGETVYDVQQMDVWFSEAWPAAFWGEFTFNWSREREELKLYALGRASLQIQQMRRASSETRPPSEGDAHASTHTTFWTIYTKTAHLIESVISDIPTAPHLSFWDQGGAKRPWRTTPKQSSKGLQAVGRRRPNLEEDQLCFFGGMIAQTSCCLLISTNATIGVPNNRRPSPSLVQRSKHETVNPGSSRWRDELRRSTKPALKLHAVLLPGQIWGFFRSKFPPFSWVDAGTIWTGMQSVAVWWLDAAGDWQETQQIFFQLWHGCEAADHSPHPHYPPLCPAEPPSRATPTSIV